MISEDKKLFLWMQFEIMMILLLILVLQFA